MAGSARRSLHRNPIAAMLDFDQRGSPYARESGASADIGAGEVQQNDTIFMAGIDGCLALP